MKTLKLQSSVEEQLYLSHFIGGEQGGYTLSAVHFAPDFSSVATDGHVLCRMERSWTYDLPALKEPTDEEKIPAEGLAIYVDAMTIKQLKWLSCLAPLRIEVDMNTEDTTAPYEHSEVRITSDSNPALLVKTHLVDPRYFPDWKRAYDDTMRHGESDFTCGRIALDPDLLNKFTGWSKLTKQKSKDFVQISCYDKEAPVQIKVSSNDRITGLLMPVRVEYV